MWDYYKDYGRHDMAWRHTDDPYHIVVSEVMLQQTQVARVAEKYPEFIGLFPSFTSLAVASVRDVLAAWQGLGYNRRALNVKRLAETIVGQYGGLLPRAPEELEKLPGIGPATARSIAAFAFNTPVAFIETNIRSVFIHEFFANRDDVSDCEIIPIAKTALPRGRSREWYCALMDYGAHLKASVKNPSQKSAQYTKQKPFKGSDREIRGAIVRLLVEKSPRTANELKVVSGFTKEKLGGQLQKLIKEGLIRRVRGAFAL